MTCYRRWHCRCSHPPPAGTYDPDEHSSNMMQLLRRSGGAVGISRTFLGRDRRVDSRRSTLWKYRRNIILKCDCLRQGHLSLGALISVGDTKSASPFGAEGGPDVKTSGESRENKRQRIIMNKIVQPTPNPFQDILHRLILLGTSPC